MQPEAKKYLFDMQEAAEWIIGFVAGKTFEDYSADTMLRLAVERCFSIMGEACHSWRGQILLRLKKCRISTHHCIPEHPDSLLYTNR